MFNGPPTGSRDVALGGRATGLGAARGDGYAHSRVLQHYQEVVDDSTRDAKVRMDELLGGQA
jgi:hypothetical protein